MSIIGLAVKSNLNILSIFVQVIVEEGLIMGIHDQKGYKIYKGNFPVS